ncbi:hypothetical protein [Streptomyces sp. NBC_00005]|uniref:hypothetical protein n=1 Tax=Streptomyces sp. NBC_00005 TaxID=2903609 RepID=UPI003246C8E1
MSEGDIEATTSYADTLRARLVMAYEACELSDLARAAVPIGEHELSTDGTTRSPGGVLADAVQVLMAAHHFLEAAVVFERMGGADWDLVGDVLGTSAHSARKRFAMAETRFRRELRSPEVIDSTGILGDPTWWRSHMIREPLEAALDLDDWVLRHEGGGGDGDLGVAPVSGRLGAVPSRSRHSRR